MTTPHDEIRPVPVHLASTEPGLVTGRRHGYRARYETITLTTGDPVQCILPEDPDRAEAYVTALDNDIVIGTQNQAGAAPNTVAGANPIGAVVLAKTDGGSVIPFPVKDCDAVFAGITTIASNSRVSVAAYYYRTGGS